MPIIIANVTRSRRIWMNSFTTTAQNRRQLNAYCFTASPGCFVAANVSWL